jgi:hypothetical protein
LSARAVRGLDLRYIESRQLLENWRPVRCISQRVRRGVGPRTRAAEREHLGVSRWSSDRTHATVFLPLVDSFGVPPLKGFGLVSSGGDHVK